jgi:16S rRNA (cytosine967-C5)-methyltransferase
MTPAARYAAAIDLLDEFLAGEPVDKLLSNWSRKNRYAGSKDRAAVRDIVFDCLRNLRSFVAQSGIKGGRGLAIGHCLASELDVGEMFSGAGYGPTALTDEETVSLAQVSSLDARDKANLPDWIFDALKLELKDTFEETSNALSTRAPVDLRVNLVKASVEEARNSLCADDIDAETVPAVETALRVTKNPRRVAGSKAYANGLVELQDSASQAVVTMLDIAPDMRVLDFCAGGGGKTLAMASVAPKAQFDVWDISASRLEPLVERAKRAGAKVHVLNDPPSSPVYDLTLVDAPCSGSGSWRRNPEGKWLLTEERLVELQWIQAQVLHDAAKTVKPNGVLVYATCSIFARENRSQVDAFLETRPHFLLLKDHSFTIGFPGDGFYCAVLKNNSGV